MQQDNIQIQQEFQKIRNLVKVVNDTIQPLKRNLYNYLNDKHNNKLDSSLDYITQDDGIRYQQQKVLDLFKRSLYYFQVIQFDYSDQFWKKIRKIKDIDFTILTMQEKAQIYKSIFHLILEYEARILEQQKLMFKQKEQAERIKRINRVKQIQEKKKEEKQKKQQEKRKQQQQQLLQAFDKATQIIENQFQKMLKQISSVKKVPYAISKQRRLQKSRQKKRQTYTKKTKSSNGITHPRRPSKPKKPRTGRKY